MDGDGGPKLTRHLVVGNRIGEDLRKIEKYATALVEDLDSGFDLEVFADAKVEGV